MKLSPILEVCVDTLEGAKAAVAGGATRIELCSSLSEGGLTPSAGLMKAASGLPVPSHAMIRPRSGLFYFTEPDIDVMLEDVATARQAGLAGVVLGVQNADDELDVQILKRLIDAAGPLDTTLHRVIDVVPNPLNALEQAIGLGFKHILTSGAQPLAPDGIDLIVEMVGRAAGRTSIMPGCGLTPANVTDLVRRTNVQEVHAACNLPAQGDRAFSDFDPPGGRFETSEHEVRAMVQSLSEI
ncbi:MAG: copper homeostasis protein CutC [Paracoccaceae bacterium]